jgi:hypothetical protein
VALSVTCPLCGATNEVASEYAGQNGPCPSCGRLIEVPRGLDAGIEDQHFLVAQSRKRRLARWLLVSALAAGLLALCSGGLAVLVMPMVTQFRGDLAKAECASNLKKIGAALRAYHAEFGGFPPSYIADRSGQPMHSWRVLILPFLGEQELYAAYDFSQPWDSSANSRLLARMPAVYQCSAETIQGNAETSYLMLSGPGWIADGPRSAHLSDVADGPANTVMTAEVANSSVLWTEPADLRDLATIDSYHGGVAHIGFVDGTTMEWPIPVNAEYFARWATIAGDDNLEP